LASKLPPLSRRFGVEVQAGEVAGVGVVAKADVHGIGSMIDGGFQRRKIAGGTDQFQRPGLGGWSGNCHGSVAHRPFVWVDVDVRSRSSVYPESPWNAQPIIRGHPGGERNAPLI